MGWLKIDFRKPGKARFRIGTYRMRGSDYRLHVSIPAARYFAMLPGEPDFVEPMLGDGEDAGKLLLVAAESGVKVTGLKHCFVIRLPTLAGIPQAKFDCEEPGYQTLQHEGRAALAIDLPQWACDPARAAAIVKARALNDQAAPTGKAASGDVYGDVNAALSPPPDILSGRANAGDAPARAEMVWAAICDAAGDARSVRLRIGEVAQRADCSTATAKNAIAWLSLKNLVARQGGGRPGAPDIFTVIQRPDKTGAKSLPVEGAAFGAGGAAQ